MKRALMVAAVSAALIATQAAASSAVEMNAGDRIGASAQTSNQMAGGELGIGILVAIAAVAAFVLAVTQDNPSSP